jgi:hypothetical protein
MLVQPLFLDLKNKVERAYAPFGPLDITAIVSIFLPTVTVFCQGGPLVSHTGMGAVRLLWCLLPMHRHGPVGREQASRAYDFSAPRLLS